MRMEGRNKAMILRLDKMVWLMMDMVMRVVIWRGDHEGTRVLKNISLH